MEVLIRDTSDEVSLLGSQIVAQLLRRKPRCVLGLATGRTPLRLYRELIRLHQTEKLDFSQVVTFNLDEYVGVPTRDEHSYRRYMDGRLFDKINIVKTNTHLLDGMAADLGKEVASYERRIEQAGGIDLQLLGIGEDGPPGADGDAGLCPRR